MDGVIFPVVLTHELRVGIETAPVVLAVGEDLLDVHIMQSCTSLVLFHLLVSRSEFRAHLVHLVVWRHHTGQVGHGWSCLVLCCVVYQVAHGSRSTLQALGLGGRFSAFHSRGCHHYLSILVLDVRERTAVGI